MRTFAAEVISVSDKYIPSQLNAFRILLLALPGGATSPTTLFPKASHATWYQASKARSATTTPAGFARRLAPGKITGPRVRPGNFTCNLKSNTKYLMVLSAAEQFGGSRQVIADAVAIAKKLRFIFVEPVYSNGRVVNPFTQQSWIPLRSIMDVDAMMGFYPNWTRIEDFMTACEARGSGTPRMHVLYANKIGAIFRPKTPSDATMKALRTSSEQIMAMVGFYRKGNNYLEFVSVDGVPMLFSKTIERTAEDVRQVWGRDKQILCVQWRQEEMLRTAKEILACTNALLAVVRPLLDQRRVLLLSDVRNVSDTQTTGRGYAESRSILQNEFHYGELLQPLDAIGDGTVQALVEASLCAASSVVVACPKSSCQSNADPATRCPTQKITRCAKCSRQQSKFAVLIHALRARLGLPPAIAW